MCELPTKTPFKDKYEYLWWHVEVGRGFNWKPLACVQAETAEEACYLLRVLLRPRGILRIAR